MGKLHMELNAYVHTIYMHKYKGKFKYVTAMGIKITLDTSGKLPYIYIYGCNVTFWKQKVTYILQLFMQTYAKMFV